MRPSLLAIGLTAFATAPYSAANNNNTTCAHIPYVPLNTPQCLPIHNVHGHHTKLLDPDTFDALFLKDAVLSQIHTDPRSEVVAEPTRSHKTPLQSSGSSTLTHIAGTESSPIPSSRPLSTADLPVAPQESKSSKLLSFEEWKRQVVQQEGEDIVQRRKITPPVKKSIPHQRQQIDSIDGAFGDDVGSMFDNSDDSPQQHPRQQQFTPPFSSKQEPIGEANQHPSSDDRPSKDPLVASPPWSQQQQMQPPLQKQTYPSSVDYAPWKAAKKEKESINPLKKLKELYNYASIDCAATVLKANKEAKNPHAILYESKDQYMLNTCSADKFVIVDLCESILIDKFVLANFEFFSSTFKDFRVYVADRYPPKEWRLLGQWQARNTRDLQIFKVETGLDWYQYIKIEFLSHYGNEYYCPLSLLRVHGNPMMEYWTLYEKPKITGEDEEDDMLKGISPEPVVDETEFLWPAFSSVDIGTTLTTPTIPTVEDMLIAEREAKSLKLDVLAEQDNTKPEEASSQASTGTSRHAPVQSADDVAGATPEKPMQEDAELPKQATSDESSSNSTAKSSTDHLSRVPVDTASAVSDTESTRDAASVSDGNPMSSSSVPLSSSPSPEMSNQNTNEVNSSEEKPADDKIHSHKQQATTDPTTPSPTEDTSTVPNANDVNLPPTTTASAATAKAPFGYGQGANMESIYKTIMTRILNLEQNATLSQRYLDDQNHMLNEVFETMEQKHREQLLQLVGQLNATASLRIDTMKRRYERLYRMTARELEMTKNETAKELQELSSKLHIMADQVVFEKRLSLIQLILLISLFLFTAANKGTLSTLSPIVAAQAEERQRRQSISHAHHQSVSTESGEPDEKPALVRNSSSSQTPPMKASKSSDVASPSKQVDLPTLSDAKRELQTTKSTVDKLKPKPTRQSTAELLSRTVEFDPIKHERWDLREDVAQFRKSEQTEPATNNTEYYQHDHVKKKTDNLSVNPDTPLLSDSPAMMSEVWPSPKVGDRATPPQPLSAVHDHDLDGDLRLSRASSFVDRMDMAYTDSPKDRNSQPSHWWKEDGRQEGAVEEDNEIEQKADHTEDQHPPSSIDSPVPSPSESQDALTMHTRTSEDVDEARVPDIDGDR